MTAPVFRFAPSPNGRLHLGHAYSALLNAHMAEQTGGHFLLRIEDIDVTRCTPELEQGIYDDLHWLSLEWEEPVRRQSEHFDDYRKALVQLIEMELVYPAFLSRGEVRVRIEAAKSEGKIWPVDPDGTPHYPTEERYFSKKKQQALIETGAPFAWRLNMDKAIQRAGASLYWQESGSGPSRETGIIRADPTQWGDVVIARKEVPTSYHLSVTLDDGAQGVTHVVRGRDLFHATAVHRLLQELLQLPEPHYHHHDLILAEDGHKLSKSRADTALSSLREQGLTPADIRAKLKV